MNPVRQQSGGVLLFRLLLASAAYLLSATFTKQRCYMRKQLSCNAASKVCRLLTLLVNAETFTYLLLHVLQFVKQTVEELGRS